MVQTSPGTFGLEMVVRVAHANRRELFQTLEGLRETVTAQERAASCELLEDCLVPNRVYWVERWATLQEIDEACRSDRFAMLRAAVELLGNIETVRKTEELS